MASTIDMALLEHALKQTDITDIVDTRIYHIKAPLRAKRPYVVLNIVVPSNDSEEFGVQRMGQHLFQWTCVSDVHEKTPCDAFLVAQEILRIYNDLKGTVESVVIKYMWTRGPREIPSGRDDDTELIVESEVHYEEP